MQIQSYFGAHIKNAILEALNQAEKEVFIAVYIFNNTDFINALRECCQRNVRVNLLLNTHENTENNGDFSELITFGVQFFDYYPIAVAERVMHHKFCVIDNQTLITGSANWSNAAFSKNDENVLIVENAPDLCGEYVAEFEKITSPLKIKFDAAADEILNKGDEMAKAIQEYASFVADYLRKYKNSPPQHLLPAVKPEYLALLPANVQSQAVAVQSQAVVVEKKETSLEKALKTYKRYYELNHQLFAVVDYYNLLGIVVYNGKLIQDCQYDKIWQDEKTKGLRTQKGYRNPKKYGYLNSNGEELMSCIYSYFSEFLQGQKGKYAVISMNDSESDAIMGRLGVINVNGKLLTKLDLKYNDCIYQIQSGNV